MASNLAAYSEHALDLGDHVQAGALERQLADEQAERPRSRVHLALDAQHGAEVATAHGDDPHGEVRGIVGRHGADGHQRMSLVFQFTSASGRRR
jgi:hypothetical protein